MIDWNDLIARTDIRVNTNALNVFWCFASLHGFIRTSQMYSVMQEN